MKLKLAILLALILIPGFLFAQSRTPQAIAADMQKLVDEINALHPPAVETPAALQDALNIGGDVYLKAGAVYPGSFVVTKSATIVGNNASLTGSTSGPALRVLASHVYLSGFRATTSHPDAVIVIGTGIETTSEQTPEDVVLNHIVIDNYRGKRGIAIHGRNVRVLQSTLTNIWTLTSQDSQAIWIGNAPCRPCVIDQNDLSAGSEIVMVGGANMAIPDVHPADIQITRNHLFRPESWRTDSVGRAVKNIIELKDGEGVLIADNNLEGSWVDAQDGPAIVLTSKSGGNVQRVTIERNRITRAGYGVQMAAADYHIGVIPTPALLSGVVIRNNFVSVSRLMGWTGTDGVFHGSRGLLAMILGGIRDVTIEDNTAITDGGSFVLADSRGSYLGLDGVLHPNPAIGRLSITNNRLVSGVYGVIVGGAMTSTATPPRTDIVDALTVSGNTIADGSAWLKKYFPANTYVTRAEFDALIVQ